MKPKYETGWVVYYVSADDPAIHDEYLEYSWIAKEFPSISQAKKFANQMIKEKRKHGHMELREFQYIFDCGWIREDNYEKIIEMW